MKLLLDISRTVARARLPRPTGIDRVERAYITWAAEHGDSACLARVDGMIYLLPIRAAETLLSWLDADGPAPRADLQSLLRPQRPRALRRAQSLVRRWALARTHPRGLADTLRGAGWQRGIYLNTGHDNLEAVAFRQLAQAGMRRLVLLHDAIPLDHPEWTRPTTPAQFRRKFETALTADAIMANSAFTADRIGHHGGDKCPPVHVLPLGIGVPPPVCGQAADRTNPPAFVVLGTLEPRKNILMLLQIWERLTRSMGQDTPHLHLIGRRGWEIEDLSEMLDRAPMMGRTVFEHGPLDDAASHAVLGRACALLFPSLVEGFGLPLAEALHAGVPVIASDIPALREVGGDVPQWLPATDPQAWQRMILAYAAPASAERAAQCARMPAWHAPTWDTHFERLENLLETILVQPVNGG